MSPRVFVVVAAVIAFGCGADADLGRERTTYDGREVFSAGAPRCEDGAGCAMELYVDGRRYIANEEQPTSCDGEIVAVYSAPGANEVRRVGAGDDVYVLCSSAVPRDEWLTLVRFNPGRD